MFLMHGVTLFGGGGSGLAATGAQAGATSQAQSFTNGIKLPSLTSGFLPFPDADGDLVQDPSFSPHFDITNKEFRTGTNAAVYGAYGNGNGQFHVRNDGQHSKIRISVAGNAGIQNFLAFDRARGSYAAQTALLSGDIFGSVLGVGHYGDSALFAHGPEIRLETTQNWTIANQGNQIIFKTTPNDSASPVTVMTVGISGRSQVQIDNFGGYTDQLVIIGLTNLHLGVFANTAYIYQNAAYRGSWAQDNAGFASWGLEWGPGTDAYKIMRSAAGSASLAPLVWLDNTGRMSLTGSAPTAGLNLPASTTARASLNVPSGTAPTSPVNGDIWSDGSNLLVRLGGVTYTLTKA